LRITRARASTLDQSHGRPGEGVSLAGPFRQTRKIDELNGGIGRLFRPVNFRQPCHPLIDHFHDGEVRFAAGVGIGRDFSLRFGQGIEYGGLAGIRQADETDFHWSKAPLHETTKSP